MSCPGFVGVKLALLIAMNLLGKRLGNIRIDTLLGVGGMGEVYRGFDVRLERHVAIKTLRSRHRLDNEAKARFLREARILSRLESSSICQVYDLLADEDADYLILEYVEGETLRQLLERRRLGEVASLTLAEKIAQALAIAHNERIVHRDLKPENVMVTQDHSVKILDFGISSAVRDPAVALSEQNPEHPLTLAESLRSDAQDDRPWDSEKATEVMTLGPRELSAHDTQSSSSRNSSLADRLTRHGSMIGTPAYMSPEQAIGSDFDEASDMFAFGLLLQEMLTGEPAREMESLHQLLTSVMRGETRPVDHREIDPDVIRLLEDLLRPDPAQRPTASDAAERLRWVLDRPNRRRRRQRRNRLLTAAFVVLCVVLTVVSVLAVRADRSARRAELEAQRAETEAKRANAQAERANQEASRAREVVDFLVELFEAASPEQALGKEVAVREILERGSERIERELQAQPLVQARLQDTLGTIHWRLGDYRESERLLTAALRIRREHLVKGSPERVQSKKQLAALFADQGRLELAEPLLRDAIQALESRPSLDVSVLAGLFNDLAALLFERGEFQEAESIYEQSLEATTEVFGERSIEVAEGLNNLAVLAWQLGDYPRAGALFQRSLSIQEEKLGRNHPNLAALLNNLGILHREMDQPETAERLHRRALDIAEQTLGDKHPDVAAILDSFGRLLVLVDRLDEAVPLFERAYAIRAEVLGRDSYEVGRTLTTFGDLLRRRGELRRAKSMLQRSRRLLRNALGETHPWTLEAAHALANLYRDAGERDEAAALYRQTLAASVIVFGDEHPGVEALRRDIRSLDEDLPSDASASS